jgi:hypothetical protein
MFISIRLLAGRHSGIASIRCPDRLAPTLDEIQTALGSDLFFMR